MTKHENIAKALKARLSELTNRVVEIGSELRNAALTCKDWCESGPPQPRAG